jgi:hypothetical protein
MERGMIATAIDADRRTTTVGLDMPADFALAAYEQVHQLLFRYRRSHTRRWRAYALTWNAVARRFVTTTRCDERFRESIRVNDMPEAGERQRQEEDLFGFFVNGLACLDSVLYATHAIAWISNNAAFELATAKQQRNVTWSRTPRLLQREFPRQRIGRQLARLDRSRGLYRWRKYRNALAHREVPRRHATVMLPGGARGATWGELALTDRLTADYRTWLGDTLAELVDDVQSFAGTTLR